MFLSASPVRQTGVPASVAQPSDSVIHRFTPVGRANHYMSSLKAGRFISLTIIDEVIKGAPEINLQSRLDYVVRQIRSVQGTNLTKETTRVVIRLLIVS
uniref:Uncharacterized protein n=1 Tax=Brassica oleracea var. oleracea TaxID=109376 RepID=A0A0D3DKL7_BRAOL